MLTARRCFVPQTTSYASHITAIAAKARSVIRDLDPTNDLTFLRLRSKKHEIMVAPGTFYSHPFVLLSFHAHGWLGARSDAAAALRIRAAAAACSVISGGWKWLRWGADLAARFSGSGGFLPHDGAHGVAAGGASA